MSQIKISGLPLYTGNTTGVYLVMNNSGETTTYKVTKETLIGSSGTSGTSGSNGSSGSSGSNGTNGSSGSSGSNGTNGSSGSSGSNGTNGSSGSSGSNGTNGSSGTSGDSLFALTGSVWNTTNNVGITGSLTVSGSASNDVNVIGRVNVRNVNSTNSVTIYGDQNTPNIKLITGSFATTIEARTITMDNDNDRLELTTNATTGSKTQIRTVDPSTNTQTIIELPCSSSWNGGLTKFKYPVEITGSLVVSGSAIITGSVQGNVNSLSISSNTASLNLSDGNFFNLQLVSGSSTHLNPSNIKPGQTISIFVNTTGSATMTFPSSIKQISGSGYVPTTSTGIDILTLISNDSSSLYLVNAKNFV